jgi:hypothetical protein
MLLENQRARLLIFKFSVIAQLHLRLFNIFYEKRLIFKEIPKQIISRFYDLHKVFNFTVIINVHYSLERIFCNHSIIEPKDIFRIYKTNCPIVHRSKHHL